MKTRIYALAALAIVTLLFVKSYSTRAQTGNVGIGTTTPESKLHTTGSVRHDTLAGPGRRAVYADSAGRLYTLNPFGGSANAGIPIPNDGCNYYNPAISSISVSGAPVVAAVSIRVTVNITHPNVSDISVFLESPGGTAVALYDASGTGANLTNTVFSDQAPGTLGSGAAPYTGHFKPIGQFNHYCYFWAPSGGLSGIGTNGLVDPNGTWKLRVYDLSAPDSGTLDSWAISFDPAAQKGIAQNNVPRGDAVGSWTGGTIYNVGDSVGIGTAMPAVQLDVKAPLGASAAIGLRSDAEWDHLYFQHDGAAANIIAGGADEGLRLLISDAAAPGATYGNQPYKEVMRLTPAGNVGIGTAAPHAPLQFGAGLQNRKVVLREFSDNNHRFHGFGVNAGALRYQVGQTSDAHIFYAGNADTSSVELVRITGTGRVGIGVPGPTQALDIRGNIRMTDGSPDTLSSSNALTLRANDNNSGGEEMSFAVGAAERMRITNSGRVGIGTATPSHLLDVAGAAKAIHFIGAGDSLTGVVNTTTAQTVGGVKTFSSNIVANAAIGIGTATPNAPLQFANTHAARKIVLWETLNNDHNFLGIGVAPGILRYQVASLVNDHVFYAGTADTNSRELFRIRGNGNVSIGGLFPDEQRLNLNGNIRMAGDSQHTLASWGVLNLHANDDGNNFESMRFLIAQTERMRISPEGFVGIGTAAPHAPLQFAATLANRKLVLYETVNNDHQFLGFGISPNIMRYQVAGGNHHVFFAGTSDSTSRELLRITAAGNVGLGVSSPNAPLQFANTVAARKLVLFETANNDHQFLGFGVSAGALRYQVANADDDHVFYAGSSSTTSAELLRVAGDGEVTMNGTLTTGGVKLPTSGGTPAPLNYYEEATATVQFSNGGTVYQSGYTVKLLRVGKQVTLTLPADAVAMNAAAHDIIMSVLDARFRPAGNLYVPLRVASAGVPEMGAAWIRSDGHVYIKRGAAGAFGGANSGVYAGAITYSVQ